MWGVDEGPSEAEETREAARQLIATWRMYALSADDVCRSEGVGPFVPGEDGPIDTPDLASMEHALLAGSYCVCDGVCRHVPDTAPDWMNVREWHMDYDPQPIRVALRCSRLLGKAK